MKMENLILNHLSEKRTAEKFIQLENLKVTEDLFNKSKRKLLFFGEKVFLKSVARRGDFDQRKERRALDALVPKW